MSPDGQTLAPNVHEAESIPEAARAEIDRLLLSGDLFRYTAPSDAPVALLERATWPDERVLTTTLAELPATAAAANLRSPTLMVVGEVASLAQVKGLINAQGDSPRDQEQSA